MKPSDVRESAQDHPVFEGTNEIEAIYRSIPVGMCALDRELRYVRINDRLANLNGIPAEEHIGKTVWDVQPHMADFISEIAGRVFRTGMPQLNIRFPEYPLKPGLCVSSQWMPLKDSSGEIIGVHVVVEDSTERKRSEEALEKNQVRLRVLSETAGKLLISDNPQGLVNELCRMVMDHLNCHAFFNFLLDEKAGRLHLNAWAGIPDEEARRIEWLDLEAAVCGCVARDGRRIVAEDIANTPDARTEFVKSLGIQAYACHPLMMRGRVIGTLSFGTKSRSFFSPEDLSLMETVTDQVATAMERIRLIQEFKHSRDELELRVKERTDELVQLNKATMEQKEVLQQIIDNVPVMITFYHPTGAVPTMNRHALEVMGLTPEDLGHVDIMERCYPDPEYRREVLNYMLEAPSGWKDIRMVVRDGKTIDSSWANVRLSDGSFIGIGIDITKRKQAEQALEAYALQLHTLNEELQEFAFIASHDLSEPLRKIQTFGSLLCEKDSNLLGELQRDYIARMMNAANRMQELLDSLLRYSRIETQGGDFKQVKLDDLVQEVTTDLEVPIRKIGASVEIDSLPRVKGDFLQLRQVFQNLIANALKYYRSEVKTVIRIHGEEHNQMGRIFVEDNGIGFDEKYLEKIFQPFQRLHGRKEYPGTGMGLAICKKIIKRHRGTITARSSPHKGSTFIITLPL